MGDTLATYPSSSNPNKSYRIIKGADGVIYCDCPGWRMRKTCKHLVAFHGGSAPVAPAPAPKAKSKVKTLDSYPKTVDEKLFASEEFQAQPWYQGCGGLVEGDMAEMMTNLDKLEKSGDFVAEPKYDGIWIAAFSDGSRVRFWSRNCLEKPYGLADMKLPAGTLLIGELGFGSEFALQRRAVYGHDFMDVFGILYLDYESVLDKDEAERRKILEKFMDDLPPLVQQHFKLAPRFTSDFRTAFEKEHEGLVLKQASGPSTIYQGRGQKVSHWMKAKKWMEADMVIMDMVYSKAATKTGTPMVESVTCGQYVKGKLKPLVKVGSMSSQWSIRFATQFEKYKGKVAVVSHFGQFKSGALRHPSLVDVRDDKNPTECVFNPGDQDEDV